MNSLNKILIFFFVPIVSSCSVGKQGVYYAEIDKKPIISANDNILTIKTGNSTTNSALYYKYKDFPKLKYSKPKIENRIKNLEQINEPIENKKYITVAYKNNQLKYIWLITDTPTFRKEI